MTSGHEHHDSDHHASIAKWVFICFLVIAGFFLITEHRAHVLGILPYLLLFACPIMHLLMHRGHGKHHH